MVQNGSVDHCFVFTDVFFVDAAEDDVAALAPYVIEID